MAEKKPPTVADAIAFAALRHGDKEDKGGHPYILHPLRVMMKMDTDEARRVAVLHDVVEDCGVTLRELRCWGLPEKEVLAVSALTKTKAENRDYPRFISRVLRNPLATKVKLADIEDNLDVSRLKMLRPKDLKRIAKYHAARRRLRGEAG